MFQFSISDFSNIVRPEVMSTASLLKICLDVKFESQFFHAAWTPERRIINTHYYLWVRVQIASTQDWGNAGSSKFGRSDSLAIE